MKFQQVSELHHSDLQRQQQPLRACLELQAQTLVPQRRPLELPQQTSERQPLERQIPSQVQVRPSGSELRTLHPSALQCPPASERLQHSGPEFQPSDLPRVPAASDSGTSEATLRPRVPAYSERSRAPALQRSVRRSVPLQNPRQLSQGSELPGSERQQQLNPDSELELACPLEQELELELWDSANNRRPRLLHQRPFTMQFSIVSCLMTKGTTQLPGGT